MSKKKQPDNIQEQETQPEQEPAVGAVAQAKELEEAAAKCAEYLDKYQRLAAEFDNFRKRTIKEREQIAIDSVIGAIENLLPVIDNFDRAMEAIASEPDSNLKQGVELIIRQLKEALNKIGVLPIEAVGTKFDPNMHNAVMHVEDDEKEESVIVEEFQKGYIYKEKIIRHSMVKVAN